MHGVPTFAIMHARKGHQAASRFENHSSKRLHSSLDFDVLTQVHGRNSEQAGVDSLRM